MSRLLSCLLVVCALGCFLACGGGGGGPVPGPVAKPSVAKPETAGEVTIVQGPGVGMPDEEDLWQRHGRNFYVHDGFVFRIDELKVYDEPVRVLQVVDSVNLLGEVFGRETWWIERRQRGTGGMVDDGTYRMELVKVGTKSYGTVLGARRTVVWATEVEAVRQGVGLDEFRTVLRSGMPLGKDWVKEAEEKRRVLEERLERLRKAQEREAEEKRVWNSPEAVAKRKEAAAAAAKAAVDKESSRKLAIAKQQLASGEELVATAGREKEGLRTMQFAVDRLQAVIRDYPGSDAAVEARKVLERVRAGK